MDSHSNSQPQEVSVAHIALPTRSRLRTLTGFLSVLAIGLVITLVLVVSLTDHQATPQPVVRPAQIHSPQAHRRRERRAKHHTAADPHQVVFVCRACSPSRPSGAAPLSESAPLPPPSKGTSPAPAPQSLSSAEEEFGFER